VVRGSVAVVLHVYMLTLHSANLGIDLSLTERKPKLDRQMHAHILTYICVYLCVCVCVCVCVCAETS
jgi:hypothetical protein